jgi:hypothetical protein
MKANIEVDLRGTGRELNSSGTRQEPAAEIFYCAQNNWVLILS